MFSRPFLSEAGEIQLLMLTIAAAIFDIRSRRIPNWLVAAGIAAGLWENAWSAGWTGLGTGAAGFGTGLLLYFPLYLLRARGAGDVKLLAAVGAIAGPGNCLWIFLSTALFGGLIALSIVMLGRRAAKTFFNVAWIASDLMRMRAPHLSSGELDVNTAKGVRLPHGAAIAAGTIAFVVVCHSRALP